MNRKWPLIMTIVLWVGVVRGQTSFTLTSPSFANNADIPSKYTCDGRNISPALQWANAPAGTKSFALIVDDPDAPKKTWVHWVIFNIPSTTTKLPEGITKGNFLSGVTNFYYMKDGIWQYGGPCPPSGAPHHYHFTLYALDAMLNIGQNSSKKDLIAAMEGHILGQAKLIGLYQRKK